MDKTLRSINLQAGGKNRKDLHRWGGQRLGEPERRSQEGRAFEREWSTLSNAGERASKIRTHQYNGLPNTGARVTFAGQSQEVVVPAVHGRFP